MTASIKPATSRSPEPFEFKSAALNLVAFTPFTADLADIESALTRRLGGRSDFFGGEGALLDLSQWPESATALDLSGLIALLRKAGLQPIGARAENDAARAVAQHAGLTVIPGSALGRDQQREAKAPAAAVAAEPTPASTLIIDKPVRSGQQIYARGGDLVVLALVSHGAEVIADGNVHVYAPLRGRALAGARGNAQARIFAHCMEAELLSVAGVYRAIDEPLPQSIKGRAAQVRLDGTKLVIEAMTLD